MGSDGPLAATRVVVAEDDPGLLGLLALVLGRVAGEVVTARDGAAALRAIQAHRPAVAVLDADMPGLSGLDVVRLVRADPALAGTKLVLITGHRGLNSAAAAAGVDRCLLKPFTPTTLSGVVRELLADAA